MPAHKIPVSGARAAHDAKRQNSRQRANAIVAQRQRLMAELTLLRQHGESRFTENALQLLTRWWSSANWSGREELLKSAAWLVRLEQHRGSEVEPSA